MQFVSQPITEYREAIDAHGGEIRAYLPYHSYIVQMNSDQRTAIGSLPFVRWIGPWHPAYRLSSSVRQRVQQARLGDRPVPPELYRIVLFDPGEGRRARVVRAKQ